VEIIRRQDGSILLSEIEGFAAELFRQIPDAADPGDDLRAANRLLPTAGETVDAAEWQELVHPGLKHLFESSLETVRNATDDTLPPNAAGSILIQPEQFDAWLNALNQARLVLAERNHLTDEQISGHQTGEVRSRADIALLQIDFYGLLQEHILAVISDTDFPGE
jgi:hypothetical protein